jgi:hypothetical protein
MTSHAVLMTGICQELKRMRRDVRKQIKAMGIEERNELRSCRANYRNKVDKITNASKSSEDEKRSMKDALVEWADATIHIWDTRYPPSNIFEMEEANELPYSLKKWLHKGSD